VRHGSTVERKESFLVSLFGEIDRLISFLKSLFMRNPQKTMEVKFRVSQDNEQSWLVGQSRSDVERDKLPVQQHPQESLKGKRTSKARQLYPVRNRDDVSCHLLFRPGTPSDDDARNYYDNFLLCPELWNLN
jgi:hypothetical protein